MRFMSFAPVCVTLLIAVQVVNVFSHPVPRQRVTDKTITELYEEFKRVGALLQVELKSARERVDFKQDVHVLAILDAVEKADKKMAKLVDAIINPNNDMTPSEAVQMMKDIEKLMKQVEAEEALVKPEHRHDKQIMRILQMLGKRGELLTEIALKKGVSLV